jgi:hypothetical protein
MRTSSPRGNLDVMYRPATQTRRIPVLLAILATATAGTAACGEDDSPSGGGDATASSEPTPPESTSETAASPTSPIEGRWQQRHTCQQLVDALDHFGLAATAPGVVLDYFPDSSAKQVAAKPDICAGATPQVHAHFFDAQGAFGSLDGAGQQVDNGPYTVDGQILTIGTDQGDGRFRITRRGDELTLEPVIAKADREAALAHPLDFSLAAWQVAVTYGGLPFHSVPCEGWC